MRKKYPIVIKFENVKAILRSAAQSHNQLNVLSYLLQILLRSGLRWTEIRALRFAYVAMGRTENLKRKEVHLPVQLCGELKTYLRRERRDRSS